MFNSAVLDVVMGLMFIYIVLSLACSKVNEYFAQILKWRAKNLEQAIGSLLFDPTFKDKVYNHPLIQSLIADKSKPNAKPHYIPANLFTMALLDIMDGTPTPNPDASLVAPQNTVDVAKAIENHTNDQIPGEVQTVIHLFIKQAQGDVNKVRQSVEGWFNAAMERASGAYRRKTQVSIFFFALAGTVLCNADTIMITNILMHQPVLRATLATRATDAAEQDTITDLKTEMSGDLDSVLGWKTSPSTGTFADLREFPKEASGWVSKVIGLLTTAFAVSLGAPFWFDLLGKFVNLRHAGKNPDDPKKKGE